MYIQIKNCVSCPYFKMVVPIELCEAYTCDYFIEIENDHVVCEYEE